MRVARAAALGVFALRSNLRMRITRVGAAFGAAIALLGPLISVATGRGWVYDPTLAFYGFLVVLLFGLRSGLAVQRESGLATFLVHNMVTRLEHAAGMAVSLFLTWLLFLSAALPVLAAISGDPVTALWSVGSWGLRSAVPLGFVLLVERLSTVRIPFVLPVFGYALAAVAAAAALGEERALELLVVSDRGDPSSLVPLAVQGAIVTGVTVTVFLAAAAFRDLGGTVAAARPRGGAALSAGANRAE